MLLLLLVSKLCSVHSLPTGILRLPWLRFFRAFSSVVRQMPGYNSQRRGTVRTLPNWWIVLFYLLFVSIVLCYILFVSIVLFSVLFVCKCVLYYCHRVATQLQLNISYHIVRIIHPTVVFDNQDDLFSAKQYQEINCMRYEYLDILHALFVRIIRDAIPLKPGTHYSHVTWAHIILKLLLYPFPCVGSHTLISTIWWLGVV